MVQGVPHHVYGKNVQFKILEFWFFYYEVFVDFPLIAMYSIPMEYSNNKTSAMHDIQLLMDKYNSGKITNISPTVRWYTNINYKVSTDKRDYLLKIHQYNKLENIASEIKILQYLKDNDIPAAYPIPDNTTSQTFIAKPP